MLLVGAVTTFQSPGIPENMLALTSSFLDPVSLKGFFRTFFSATLINSMVDVFSVGLESSLLT
jgi:hypothetical protein